MPDFFAPCPRGLEAVLHNELTKLGAQQVRSTDGGVQFSGDWLHAKLFMVLLLVGYHHYCGKLVKEFAADRNTRSHVFYRWFNEVPVLILIAVVILVTVKPF